MRRFALPNDCRIQVVMGTMAVLFLFSDNIRPIEMLMWVVKDHGVRRDRSGNDWHVERAITGFTKWRLRGMERRRKAVGAGEIIVMSRDFTGRLYFLV